MERQATRLRAQRPLPGAPLGPVCTVNRRCVETPGVSSMAIVWNLVRSDGLTAGRNLTGNLFALLNVGGYGCGFQTKCGRFLPRQREQSMSDVIFMNLV
jgi:hypothetical protein